MNGRFQQRVNYTFIVVDDVIFINVCK